MLKYQKFFRSIHKLGGSEQGSTLVYGALILVAILAVSSLAIDGSNAYLQRREMQTAADAAALAGTHVLAMGGSSNAVKEEVRNVAQLNDATVEVVEIEDNHIVRVTVESTVQTYLARVINIDSLQAKASAAAMFEPIPSVDGPPPICMDLACVNSDVGQVTVVADEINSYCADSFEHYWGGANSGLFLHSPEPDNPLSTDTTFSYAADFREFSRVGDIGIFEEYADGTARILMHVENNYDRGFTLDLSLSGRTSTPPNSSSPYLTSATQNSDTAKWYYYSEWSGSLTGLPGSMYEGAEATIYGAGAAFQVGKGATYYRGDLFGAAGWAWVYVSEQPNTGVTIFEDGWSAADVYFQLNDCDYLTFGDDNSTPGSDVCTYRWLDFNGDMTNSSDIADYLNNPAAAGLQEVGDLVAEGPWDNQTAGIEDALSEWAGHTVPVAVCGPGTEDDEYPIAGFTGFELTSFDFSQFPKKISGQFQPIVVNSNPLGDAVIPDYLARDIRLIQ